MAQQEGTYEYTSAEQFAKDVFPAENTPPTPATTTGSGDTKSGLEPTTFNQAFGSRTTFALDGSYTNPGIPLSHSAIPSQDDLKFKTGTNWGDNSKVGIPDSRKQDKTKNAQNDAREKADARAPSKANKSDTPTIAAADFAKEALEQLMDVDPGNIAGTVQKAMHSMLMIKMMDKLSSPAGIASMAAGALGGGLGGLAKAVGAGAMLGGLSAAMPALQASLPGSQLGALNLGMQGMISGNPVGALAAASVQAAAQTVASITGAAALISPSVGINTAVMLGGPTMGLTPESLAYRVAMATPGTTIKTSALIRGVAVATTLEVVDSFMQDQLGNIPKLAGDEHISIATSHIPVMGYGVGSAMVGTLNTAGLIAGEVAGAYLGGAVREISGELAGAVSGALGGGQIGGVLGNALGGAIGGAIGGGVAGIVDAGLNKLLGAPLSGMLGVAGKLVPNIAGSIGNVVNVHAVAGGLAAGAISGAMNEATKALGLASQGFKITNVFGPGLAEQVADMHDSMIAGVVKNAIAGAVQGAVAGAVAGAIANKFPTTMQAYCNGVKITVRAQTVKPGTAAVVGAIAGAFSQL